MLPPGSSGRISSPSMLSWPTGRWYYNINVSDKMHVSGPDPSGPAGHKEEIQIEVDGLPVPKPIVNGSGFQPTIDGWQGVEIEVSMDDKWGKQLPIMMWNLQITRQKIDKRGGNFAKFSRKRLKKRKKRAKNLVISNLLPIFADWEWTNYGWVLIIKSL